MALKYITVSLNGLLSAVYGTIAAILFFGLWRHRGRAFNLLGLMLALVTLTSGLSYLAHALIIGLSPWRPEKVTYTTLSAVSLVPAALLLALYRRFEAFLGGARLWDETQSQLRERNEQLQSLVELSAQLSRYRQLPAVLSSALVQCLAHSRAHMGLFFLRDSEQGQLALTAQHGVEADAAAELGTTSPVRALVGRVLEEGALLTESVGELDAGSPLAARRLRHLLCLPVRSPQGITGVICLLGKRALAPTDQQLDLLEAIGQQIGIAVESARWSESQDRLGQELQHRVAQATEELRASYRTLEAGERRLQTVVDSMPSGLLMLDARDVIAMANQQAEELLGIERDDLLERPLAQCGLGDDLVEALGAEAHAADDRRDVSVAGRSIRVDTALVTDHDGHRLGRVCVLTDVTREREIDQMKTDFVSLVSHELRTPLTSIIGFVALLLEEEVGDLNATQRKSLHSVRRQARRLSGLISDLLDVARMESRRATMRQDEVDLESVVEGALQELAPQAEEKQLTLEFTGAPDALTLRGDSERLTQVFTNLVSNAIKFTPEGGRIEVTATRADSEIVATVCDTGPGIAADELPRIFDKFYQVEKVASRQTGGTGLGLAIVKTIVEAHGGKVSVGNVPEGGASFVVRLPSRTRALTQTQPPATPLILVVDDDPAATVQLTDSLRQAGYRTLAVDDFDQAALQANAVRPDLIAFTLRPPNEHAVRMLDALQRDAATRDIPILALSAMTDTEALLRGAAETLTAGEGELPVEDGAGWRHRLGELLAGAGYTVRGVTAGAATLAAHLRTRWPGRRSGADDTEGGSE